MTVGGFRIYTWPDFHKEDQAFIEKWNKIQTESTFHAMKYLVNFEKYILTR